jgi:integrase
MGRPAVKTVLSLHPNGQWYKKVLGKAYYFGTDYDSAMAEYLDCREHLLAGRGKPIRSGEPTLAELGNLYYDGCCKRVASGDLEQRSLDDSKKSLDRLIDFRGGKDHPSQWGPLDYCDIKQMLFEPVPRSKKLSGGRATKNGRRAATTVNGDVRRIKAFLSWCRDTQLISTLNFGREFSESAARVNRLAKQAAGKRVFSKKELTAIIGKATDYFLPVIMLGINGGMGAKDIANLRLDQFDGSEWLDCPRLKSGQARRIWLWPETRKIIKHYLSKVRREPWATNYADIAFLTMHRTPWVRERADAATQAFAKARSKAGLKSGTYYDLRRTFQTIGDETLDFPAVGCCMGHIPKTSDMAARYREINDERVKAVCQHVRKWLFGK